jgi:hypothetical protein
MSLTHMLTPRAADRCVVRGCLILELQMCMSCLLWLLPVSPGRYFPLGH